MKEDTVLYFDKGGPEHTGATVEAVKARIPELQPEAVIVASTTGKTGLEMAQALESTNTPVIIVPFQGGTKAAQQYGQPDPEIKAQCECLGAQFLPDTPICRLLDEDRPDIVNAWRVLGQGFKVALQVASMCVDTALIESSAKVVAIGGTGNGADTAVALTIRGYEDVLKSKINEIIAIPRA